MRFCFNLFDYNDDGLVCLHDMIKFNIEFAGVAVELINDHMDITQAIQAKKRMFEQSDVPNFNYELGEPAKV
jgi:Ca2+-binding EF-hand superfamily protein